MFPVMTKPRLFFWMFAVALTLAILAYLSMSDSKVPKGSVQVESAHAKSTEPLVIEDSLSTPILNTAQQKESWVERAQRSKAWPIPNALRIPGGPVSTALANSPEEWLSTLPPLQVPVARAFIERNATAYAFRSKAELAWLIETGFPSIEEAAYFAGLPRAVTCVATATELTRSSQAGPSADTCTNPKLAALAVDAHIRELAGHELRSGEVADLLDIGGKLTASPNAIDALNIRVEAEALLRKSVGAYRFYQQATLAGHSDVGGIRPTDPGDEATVALALAFACEGDGRLSRSRAPELWSRPATLSVLVAIGTLGDNLRGPDGQIVCGLSRRIGFPDGF